MDNFDPWHSIESRALRVALIGDYDCDRAAHSATYAALHHAAGMLHAALDLRWIGTEACEGRAQAALTQADGVFVTTGSPYRSLQGALDAIGWARENGIPLIGTCGGFQHIALEYARGVLRVANAAHAEYDPYAADADDMFVTRLQCSLVGKTLEVQLEPHSRAGRSYGTAVAEERYYCSFGLHPERVPDLTRAGLRVSGRDGEGEPRIIELPDHPFFIGTLFVPQTRSTPERPHPLVISFLRAAQQHAAVPL